jgi:hypothetical protein
MLADHVGTISRRRGNGFNHVRAQTQLKHSRKRLEHEARFYTARIMLWSAMT